MARGSVLVIQGARGESAEAVVSAAIRSHAVECDGGITIRFEDHGVEFYLELGPDDVEALFADWRRERAELASYLEGLAAVEREAARPDGP